ncbi:hypothetical protein AB0D98_30805 [Streptomyces sp. NPDC047987]|uniref:hypothetical protein n=1 Tax=unclassified Streptomyces TaxID=2593676 RepID=UPI00344961B4
MPTHYQDPVLTCDTCRAITARPPAGQWQPLHEEGWRWRGADERPLRFVPKAFVFSCPNCPPAAP